MASVPRAVRAVFEGFHTCDDAVGVEVFSGREITYGTKGEFRHVPKCFRTILNLIGGDIGTDAFVKCGSHHR